MGSSDMALFKFSRAILTGGTVQLFNGGHHKRDFTFIADIVDGVIGTLDQIAVPDPTYDPLGESGYIECPVACIQYWI